MSHLTFKLVTYVTIACHDTFFIIKLLCLSPFSPLVFLICKKRRGNSVKFTTKKWHELQTLIQSGIFQNKLSKSGIFQNFPKILMYQSFIYCFLYIDHLVNILKSNHMYKINQTCDIRKYILYIYIIIQPI